MPTIKKLNAIEILDSRGRPTVRATCTLASGAVASASVPSGASTGAAEALELRDNDPHRYRGLGCRQAVANINGAINDTLSANKFAHHAELDQAMIDLDGTPNKSRLGANAILATSLAVARASAVENSVPLYQHFADHFHNLLAPAETDPPSLTPSLTLPRPTINLFSGGKHAGGQVPIQDVLVVPAAAQTIDAAMAMTYEVFQAAADLCAEKYGVRALTADEGGLAPPFADASAMLDDAVSAIERAGFSPGTEVALAIDVASTHFYQDGTYHLGATPLQSSGMIEQIATWVNTYPIVSVEDGLAEDDWAAWSELYRQLGERVLVLGDDLLCTNPTRIQRAIDTNAANALLLKVNQIGTLTEAAEAYRLARSAGWRVTISARSGETEDDWLADLVVGWRGDQIKVGSITQSERLAKYNRLLAIESETNLPLISWPNTSPT